MTVFPADILPAVPATTEADTVELCSTCPHPAADHDEVARRYCAATMDHALPRGCICGCADDPS